MTASNALAARIRLLLAPSLTLVEKKMFGGIGFMLAGNMMTGTTAKGALLVRIDPAKAADALARPGAERIEMGARVMTAFVAVDPAVLADDASLRAWLDYALAHTRTLPAK